jgi:amidase/aspartyl-tRNA(Asn)/glutamyl-tRNA(Gln) amidotransferase subunit A
LDTTLNDRRHISFFVHTTLIGILTAQALNDPIMKYSTIKQWQIMATTDKAAWSKALNDNLSECRRVTKNAVLSDRVVEACVSKHGSLAGVPYGAKDLFNNAGYPTRASSILPALLNQPADKDAEAIQHLAGLGATCATKTQMNEFAYGLSGENAHYGDCPHPKMKGCLSGGSSSGSAHAVAAGYLPLALGTDTGGSIRLPSAWCGIYGIRWIPGYFMEGVFPLALSFDAIGWFTRTAPEMTAVLQAWFELDEKPPARQLRGAAFLPADLVSAETQKAMVDYSNKLNLRINEGFESLRRLLEPCQLAFNVLQSSEAYCLHASWLKKFQIFYDPVVEARIVRGSDWSAADRRRSQDTRDEVTAWFTDYFETHDFLVMPICPGPSIPVAEATVELREQTLQLTTPASLAGLPALSIPIWLDTERSVGLQFIFKRAAPIVPLAILDLCANI